MKAEVHHIQYRYQDRWEETGYGEWDVLSIYLPDFDLYIEDDSFHVGSSSFTLAPPYIEYGGDALLITNLGNI